MHVWKLSEARERMNHLGGLAGTVSSAYNMLEIEPVSNSQNGKAHIHGAVSRILTGLAPVLGITRPRITAVL